MSELIPVKEDIIEIIEEDVGKAESSPPLLFGHGPESYANIQGQDIEIEGDIAWLFPVMLKDKIQAGGTIDTKYSILMAVGQLSDLSADANILKAHLKAMSRLTKKIIVILDEDERIKDITDIQREAIYFTQDLNITGYGLRMTIELEHEDFDYCVT